MNLTKDKNYNQHPKENTLSR